MSAIDNSFINAENLAVGDKNVVGNQQHFYSAVPAASATPVEPTRPGGGPLTRVFVVHGRDHQVRTAAFDLLRALRVYPWEWEQVVADLGQGAPYSGDVVAHAVHHSRAALVLLTPDDLAQLHPDLHTPGETRHETTPNGQPRPNVLIELGMVLAAYPERSLIAEFGTLRPIGDISGRNVIRFDGTEKSIRISLHKIVERLRQAGCAVDDSGDDWRSPERFLRLDAYQRSAGRSA